MLLNVMKASMKECLVYLRLPLTAYRDEGLHEGVEGVGRAAAATAVVLLVVKVKLAAEELRGKCSECSEYRADEL